MKHDTKDVVVLSWDDKAPWQEDMTVEECLVWSQTSLLYHYYADYWIDFSDDVLKVLLPHPAFRVKKPNMVDARGYKRRMLDVNHYIKDNGGMEEYFKNVTYAIKHRAAEKALDMQLINSY